MTQTAKTADVVTEGAWKLNPATGEEIIADGECIVLARVPSAKSGLYNRRAPANARLIVSACNSYKRQCGDRAIEAAEADLLGRCLEALKMAAPLLAEAQEALCGRDDVCVTSDGDDALLPLRDAINFILSQAREAQA